MADLGSIDGIRAASRASDPYVEPRQHSPPSSHLPHLPVCREGNSVAIHLITEHIRTKLQQHDLRRVYTNLELIPSTYQVGEEFVNGRV